MKPSVRTWAVVASVLLHAALWLVLARLPPRAVSIPEGIEIEVQYVDPVVSEPTPAPAVAEAPQATPPRAPTPPRPRPKPALAKAANDPRAGGGTNGEAEQGAAQAGGGGSAEESNPSQGELATGGRDLDLSISSEVGGLALRAGTGRGRLGETWSNEPGGFPDPEALKAAGAAEARRNVDGWLRDGLATSRAQNGADDYFLDLGKALEKAVAVDAQRLLAGDAAKDLVAAWQAGASQYGATGNPYAPGTQPGPAPAIDGNTPLNEAAGRMPGSGLDKGQSFFGGGVGPAGLKQKLEMGRSLRDFADGKFGGGLLAIVDIRQGGDGKLLELTLTQPSGNAAFDAHVLRRAPEAVTTLRPPPEKGVGIHPEGLRSTWSFQGRVVYKRKLQEMDPLRDGWYVALLAAGGLATGTFEETTGEVEIPDFRNPQFKLTVKLLKVY